MVNVTRSECIYHPGKEAVHRCKQCGATTCHKCTVLDSAGKFCSNDCRVAHHALLDYGSQQPTQAPSLLFVRIRKVIGKLLFLLAILVVAGIVGSVFYIPVLSEITQSVRGALGL